MISGIALSWLICGLLSGAIYLLACQRTRYGITFHDIYTFILISILGYISLGISIFCLLFLWADREY